MVYVTGNIWVPIWKITRRPVLTATLTLELQKRLYYEKSIDNFKQRQINAKEKNIGVVFWRGLLLAFKIWQNITMPFEVPAVKCTQKIMESFLASMN
jgi:ABC-type ATPase involved in cell division